MPDATLHTLLKPIRLSKAIQLKNRIVMAPMTRRFANKNHVISPQSIAYYAKRSRAGLIVTEGTIISRQAMGYGLVPGIFLPSHIDAWKRVTEAVHEKEGVIFIQLWHSGRVSHVNFHQGLPPLSASAMPLNAELGKSGLIADQAKAATLEEINQVCEQFYEASLFAKQANFDGVEIHAGNGYLIDQFLHACTNKRSDQFGGSPENNARFCLKVVQACIQAIGSERIGIRLSPGGHMSNILTEPLDQLTFQQLLIVLHKYNLCYVHTSAFDDKILYPELGNLSMTDFMRQHYSLNMIASGNYSLQQAVQFVSKSSKNLISLGRPFIANPDLIDLIETGKKWKQYTKESLSVLI